LGLLGKQGFMADMIVYYIVHVQGMNKNFLSTSPMFGLLASINATEKTLSLQSPLGSVSIDVPTDYSKLKFTFTGVEKKIY
jgi:hypothetical protein